MDDREAARTAVRNFLNSRPNRIFPMSLLRIEAGRHPDDPALLASGDADAATVPGPGQRP